MKAFQGLEVDVDLAFVVGGAAAIDIAVAGIGLERRRSPKIERFRRLYVVVAIEKDGGFAGSFQRFGVNQGMKIGGNDFHLIETGGAKVIGYPFGGAFDIGLVFGFGADGRDSKKFAEFGKMLFAPTFDKFSKVHIRPSGTTILFLKKALNNFREITAAEWTWSKGLDAVAATFILRPDRAGYKFRGDLWRRRGLRRVATPVRKGN